MFSLGAANISLVPLAPGYTSFQSFSRLVSFWLLFATLLVHFGRLLAPFGLPCASLWFLLGSRWVTFGSILALFDSRWAPRGSLLAPFWCSCAHFCSRWRPNFSLLESPTIFLYFYIFVMKILCNMVFFHFFNRISDSLVHLIACGSSWKL